MTLVAEVAEYKNLGQTDRGLVNIPNISGDTGQTDSILTHTQDYVLS